MGVEIQPKRIRAVRTSSSRFASPYWVKFRGSAPVGTDPLRILERAPVDTGVPVQAWGGVEVRKGWTVIVDPVPSLDLLVVWFEDRADALGAAGCEGLLQPAPNPSLPFWFFRPAWNPARPELLYTPGAHFAWAIDADLVNAAPNPACGWGLPRPITTEIVDHLWRWVTEAGPELQLEWMSGYYGHVADVPGTVDLAVHGLEDQGSSGFVASDRSTRVGRLARSQGIGMSVICQDNPTAPWSEIIDPLRSAMVALAEHADLSFIASVPRASTSWFSRTPFLTQHHTRLWKHLLGEYIYAPCGVQVLTGAHLERAASLEGWRTTTVAPDRYLLEAVDLEPWYGRHEADPGVIAQAFHDFAPAILTDEICEANPPPWPTFSIPQRAGWPATNTRTYAP